MWKKLWFFVETATSAIYTCAVIHHRAGAGQAVLNLRRFRPRMWRRY